MSSTLHGILDKLKALLEGTAGDGRVITAGKFVVVAEDENTIAGRCIADPRPAYIVDGGEADAPAHLSDLTEQDASQHVWKARAVQVFVAYGFESAGNVYPRAPLSRPTTITDDEELLVSVLTHDLNCALVDGWASCDASTRIIVTRDESTGLAAIKWLVADLVISYWETRT